MLTQRKFEEGRYAKSSNDEKQNCRFNICFASTSGAGKCCFCKEAEDHIVLKGLIGTQVVQFFACKKFADVVPNESF